MIAQLTPLSETELREALIAGHLKAFGRAPTVERLSGAWAHVSLETGRGKYIWCNNFGNMDTSASGPETFETVPEREVIGGKPTTRVHRRTGYLTAEDGAAAYWRALDQHWWSALRAFDAGDPVGAAGAFKKGYYFTAPLAEYAPGLASLYREAMRRWPAVETYEPAVARTH